MNLVQKRFNRQTGTVIIGLAFLWASLQSSSYYPFSLTGMGTWDASGQTLLLHSLYSVVLIAFFIAIVPVSRRFAGLFSRGAICTLGLCGFLGQLLLYLLRSTASNTAVAFVSALMVAVYICTYIIIGGSLTKSLGSNGVFATIASSLLYSLLSGLLLLFGIDFALIAVVGPAVSLTCFFLCVSPSFNTEKNTGEQEETPDSIAVCSATSPNTSTSPQHTREVLQALPWRLVIPCLLFVFLGVVLVRALTAPDTSMTGLTSIHRAATSFFSLVIIALVAACFSHVKSFQGATMLSFLVIALSYIASLLFIMVFYQQDLIFDKRLLVASEHCLEVFLWLVFAYISYTRKLDPVIVFAVWGLAVVAVPWLFSCDIAQVSGLVLFIETNKMAIPVSAGVLFALTVAAFFLLVGQVRSVENREETKEGPDWQRRRFSQATAAAKLTSKEYEVLFYVYRGYSAKSIAEVLYISEHTVRSHTLHAYRKLNIHSKQNLISYIDSFHESHDNIL